MRIIFMGTPDFAVPSLDILFKAGYNIVAVITSPDKMGGRGRKKLIESDVKKYADSKGIKILQPTNLKNEKFIEELSLLNADLQIVVAFRMLPEIVWNMPAQGTYNLHGSLLPKYRGAAPINWAIIKGEKVTGVTSFKLQHEIDTGSILLQKEIPIYQSDTAGVLHDRMKYISAEVVYETVKMIQTNQFELRKQDNSQVSHAPKLNHENTQINFLDTRKEINNFVRGLNPYPSAWFSLGDKKMKVHEIIIDDAPLQHDPTTILSDNKKFIKVACNDGYVFLNIIQYEGKKRMRTQEFLNGFDAAAFHLTTVS